MGERVSSSSISRSVAPEARSSSPQTSASTATLEAISAMYSAVCVSVPQEVRPSITDCTPPYRPHSRKPNTPMMRNAVSEARVPVRRTAVAKACSFIAAKRRASAPSCTKLCTTGIALSTSAAMPLVSAMRSWLARESLRTRRPITSAGSTTATITTATVSTRRGLVASSIASAPTHMTALRSPMLTLEPTAFCTTVVSVVRRLSTSPVFTLSKNCGLWRSTCA